MLTELRELPPPVLAQPIIDLPPRRVRESLAVRPAAGPVEAPPTRRRARA